MHAWDEQAGEQAGALEGFAHYNQEMNDITVTVRSQLGALWSMDSTIGGIE